jgi:hypothetical protein
MFTAVLAAFFFGTLGMAFTVIARPVRPLHHF